MNRKIISWITHPISKMYSVMPMLNQFLNHWQKIYGIDDYFEKKIVHLIKSNIKQPTITISMFTVGDGKLYHYFRYKTEWKIKGITLRKKTLEFSNINFSDNSISLVDSIYISEPADILVCNNILNSIDYDERIKYIEYVSKKYNKILFIGEKVYENRKALGPEPIGEYGCEQYVTNGIYEILKEKFTDLDDKSGKDLYTYWVQR